MLGRKDYTRKELEAGQSAVNAQLASYKRLAATLDDESVQKVVRSAFDAFQQTFFNNLILTLDRFYVHRLRMVTGKEGGPLNEVEMISDSLVNNGGILREKSPINYQPEDSVAKLGIGDSIRLTAEQFEDLSAAFFAELETKFLQQ